MTVELQDLLDDDLIRTNRRIIVNQAYELIRGETFNNPSRATTIGNTKSLSEFYDLIRMAITNYETRAGISDKNKVNFTEEEPDINSETESIVFSLIEKVPGQFAQGKPMSGKHVNLRPVFREEFEDIEHPGYRKVINGYFFDSIVRFTCWARTNKVANARADWFEDMMEDYSWWFKLQGVDRVLYMGRKSDIVTTIHENKWYGRPMDYFVRTEKIRIFEEKTLEEVLVNLSVNQE